MTDAEFWAEVKANLREAYAPRALLAGAGTGSRGAGRQRPRARLPAADGANFSDHRATGAMEGRACLNLQAG